MERAEGRGIGSIVAPLARHAGGDAPRVGVGRGPGAGRARAARPAATPARARARAADPRSRLADGLRRIALGQVDLAIELLRGADGEAAEEAVHETRKALKRLRAIMRLLEGELGERTLRARAARRCATPPARWPARATPR